MLKKILLSATLLCAAGFASAATMTVSNTFGPALTEIDNATISVAQFDTMGGTRILQSVMVTFESGIVAEARLEHLGPNPRTITTSITGDATLTGNGASLAVGFSDGPEAFMSSAFDGSINFGGTSGITYAGMTAFADSGSDMVTLTGAAASAYEGMGMMDFIFNASAQTVVEGSGNLVTQFMTNAQAEVEVVYTWVPRPVTVSAPSQVAFLGLGLLGFAALRKARK